MSLGYAEKLTYIEDVGEVGMSEVFDPPRELQEKIEKLAVMIKESKHLVVFTGAGISTSCGIPDFRGPKGIWTLQREGKAFPEASLPFHRAMPSRTHMALVELEKAGILKFVISQNIDGLHLRSGIPREKLSELHGNSFMEICPSCEKEYLRDFEVQTVGMKETPRRCVSCGARLTDSVVDWENALPLEEWNQAEENCKIADVVLCLGTSLQISPACDLPLKCLRRRRRGKLVIVNLQETPKDKKASLLIHGAVDQVVGGVIDLLDLRIQPFVRIDLLQIVFTQGLSLDQKYMNWTLRICSVHGDQVPLPFISSVEVSFSGGQNMKEAFLHEQPLRLKRRISAASKPFQIFLKLKLGDGCGCTYAQITIPVDFADAVESCEYEKEAILQKLRDETIQDFRCGRSEVIERKLTLEKRRERKLILDKRCETSVYAVVTNVVVYDKVSASLRDSTPERQEDGDDETDKPLKRQKGAQP